MGEATPISDELPLDEAKKLTTADVMGMLWNKYTEKGEHVLLFDVPNVVGTRQERRCDAVAIGMWGSSGRLIQGFEIKASRSDWLREVKDVGKADHFLEQCDRWWLVCADIAIAKPEEIPDAWGWMVATRNGLRIQRPAKQLPQDETHMKRLWAFALIRRAYERGDRNSAEFQAAMRKYEAECDRRAEERVRAQVARISPELERLKKQVADFEAASGMKLEDWRLGNVGKLARRLAALKEDGYGGFTRTLTAQLESLQGLSKKIAEALEAVSNPAATGENDD